MQYERLPDDVGQGHLRLTSLGDDAAHRRPWRALVDSDARSTYLAATDECFARAATSLERAQTSSLADGYPASSLLAAYAWRAKVGGELLASCAAALDAGVALIDRLAGDMSLFHGISGLAWSAEHVSRITNGSVVPFDVDDVDELLAGAIHEESTVPSHALVEGDVGVGLYALERLPRAAAHVVVNGIVEKLSRTATRDEAGIRWGHRSEGLIALGPAHGVAGTIVFLARVASACDGAVARDARALLDGSVHWLMEQRLESGAGSVFPHPLRTGVPPESSSLGWCNGDPGIGLALLVAGRLMGRDDLRQIALEVLLAAADRRGEHVVQSHLCCGSAGLAHAFNRAYQESGDDRLRLAAIRWLDVTMSRQSSWGSSPSLLTGVTGIALVLLGAATDVEPAWDVVLAASA